MEQHQRAGNGVDVYSYSLPHLHSFCISLYVKAGILYEGENENGITHFLEHIHFRSLGGIPQQDLYRRLKLIGAEFNACTYKEFMYFYITAAPAHFHECAEIMSRLLSPLTASHADIRTERKRIQSEIREDDFISSLEYFANQTIWEGTGLRRLITGTITGIGGIDLDMLQEKKSEIFTCENMFFYVTGNFTQDDIAFLNGEIERYPTTHSQSPRSNTAAVPNGFQNRNAKVTIRQNDYLPSVQFTFDVEYQKYTIAEMDLLYDIMFAGDLSRFTTLLSEQSGLLYDFDAYLERYRNIGTIYLQYSIMKSRLLDSVELTARMFASMKKNITQGDLALALPKYTDNRLFSLDSAERLNWQMAYDNHILNCGYKSISELGGMYQLVTPERLLQIAGEIFRPDNLVVSIKGSKKNRTADRIREILSEL